MNELEIKIYFYKNKIEKIKKKIIELKEHILLSRNKMIEFIKTIDDIKIVEILNTKINKKFQINTKEIETTVMNLCFSREYYLYMKNYYRSLKYMKDVLQENMFLYWSDILNKDDKIEYIYNL